MRGGYTVRNICCKVYTGYEILGGWANLAQWGGAAKKISRNIFFFESMHVPATSLNFPHLLVDTLTFLTIYAIIILEMRMKLISRR
jgi:hypothetical protein